MKILVVGATGSIGRLSRLDPDPADALDAVHDVANMPLNQEPQRVRDDLLEIYACLTSS
jgi:hypothetical protein